MISRSAGCPCTSVDSESALLSSSGSASLAETAAVLIASPSRVVWTVRATVASAPLAKLPRSQVTVPFCSLQEPWDGVAETKFVPDGTESVTWTPVTLPGPLLVTVMA